MKRPIPILISAALLLVVAWGYLTFGEIKKDTGADTGSVNYIDNTDVADSSGEASKTDSAITPYDVGLVAGTFMVQQVTDGDTFTAWDGTEMLTVRVLGIDSPETAHSPSGAQCYNEEATAEAEGTLSGTSVTLLTDPTQDKFDKYGRLLAYVELPNGTDFGQFMVAGGFAKEYTFKGVAYGMQSVYKSAEDEAKAANRGLWGCN